MGIKQICWIILFIFVFIKYIYKKNFSLYENKFFYIYFITVLVLPVSNFYNIIGFNIHIFNVSDILLAILLYITIINFKTSKFNIKKIKNIDKVVCILFFIYLFQIINGKMRGNYGWGSELILYGRIFITYLVFRANIMKNKNSIQYIKIFILASVIYSGLVILIAIFGKSILPYLYNELNFKWWGTSRVTFNNSSILILTPAILTIFTDLFSLRNKTITLIITFTAVFLSKGRTLIVCYAIILFFICIYELYKKNYIKTIYMILGITSIVVILFIIFRKQLGEFLVSTNIDILERYGQLLTGSFSSGDIRNITNEINIYKLREGYYLGNGMGYILSLYNEYREAVTNGLFIDNGVLTFAIKMGAESIILIVLLIVNVIKDLIKKINDKAKTTFIVLTFIIYNIMVSFVNAQIVYSLPVNTATVILVLILVARLELSTVERSKNENLFFN